MASAAPENNDSPAAEKPRPWWKSPPRAVRAAAAWAGAHRRSAALTALAILLVPLVVAVAYRTIRQAIVLGPATSLEEVLAALARGDYAETHVLAKRLQAQGTLAPEERGGPLFALGAATLHEAEASSPRERGQLLLVASRYLEEAMQRGFPPGREGEGLYLYGKSLYERGQMSASRHVLSAALKADPAQQTAVHYLLAAAYLHDPKPNLAQALEQNALYLKDAKLSAARREEGLHQRGEILLEMGKLSECGAALKQIPENSRLRTAAILLRARALMHEAESLHKAASSTEGVPAEAKEKYQAAIELLRQVQSYDVARPAAVRQAMYLIGLCFSGMGDDRAALAQFTRTFGLHPNTPEGTAASYRAAALLGKLGRDAEALSEYRRMIGSYARTSLVRNPWLTPSQLYAQLWNAYQQYIGRQQFGLAEPYIPLMKPLVSQQRLLRTTAEFYTAWGQSLSPQAETAPPARREYLRNMARKQFRRAGDAYTELARLFPAAREYTDRIWNGALAYFEGHDFRRAAQLLQVYLKNEVQSRRPQALTYLGESQLALGRDAAALETLKECISNYPRDTATCRARLLAAKVLQEKGRTTEAVSLLGENLNGDYLTPAGKEWRDSLLALGELLAKEGKFDEASRRLEEYVQRYPGLPDTLLARYLLAETLRRSALAAREEMKKDRAGSSWGVQTRRIRQHLAESLEQYQAVVAKLAAETNDADLSPRDKILLRNCLFAVGDVLFEQGDYEAAIRAYFAAADRYHDRPEALAAYEQISRAYRRLDRPAEARNAIRQAQIALSGMKSDAAFETTSLYSRKQWEERLQRLSVL